jgi:nucleoside phosphorylase/CheY-like chemotaxis protein
VLSALIVDDDVRKRTALREVLLRISGDGNWKVVEAGAIVPAKEAMARETFDLLLLDIALPLRSGEDVRMNGGSDLLSEIVEVDLYRVPTHIVAVTGYSDIFAAMVERWGNRLVATIHYDERSETWESKLGELVGRIIAAGNARDLRAREPSHDVAIVTALVEPELRELLALPLNWREMRVGTDPTVYHEGEIRGGGGGGWALVAATAARMGMAATAALSGKMIAKFRPRMVAMTGIAAGYSGRTNIGDIIAADPSWDCGSGKWTESADGPRFRQAPRQLALDPEIREHLRSLSLDTAGLDRIHRDWPGERPTAKPRIKIGPLASNAAVLGDGKMIERIAVQDKDLLGVEMEAYGVFAAAETSDEPRPKVVVLKTVVDLADGAKDDRFQPYGAYASAATLCALLERMMRPRY